MVRTFALRLGIACAASLSCLAFSGKEAAAAAPYEILLHARSAVVTPERTRDAQTGGGYIQVTQLEPNVVMVLMRGAVASGSGHKSGSAAMQFDLKQDFEIVPMRTGLRPPRLILTAWAIGALESTLEEGGSADQAPACASINSGDNPLLKLCIQPHGVTSGQNLLVNDRNGPLEMTVVAGGFCLHQTFAISVNQPKNHCHPGTTAADFDPDPKFDAHFNEVLKPFRAVPHRDFGFRVILQVVEEPTQPGLAPPADILPPPTREDKKETATKTAKP